MEDLKFLFKMAMCNLFVYSFIIGFYCFTIWDFQPFPFSDWDGLGRFAFLIVQVFFSFSLLYAVITIDKEK